MSGFGKRVADGLSWSLGVHGFCFFPKVANNDSDLTYVNGIYYPYRGNYSYIDGRAVYVGYYNGPHEFIYPYLYRGHSYYRSKEITKPYSASKTCYDYYSRFSSLSYSYSTDEQEYQVKKTAGKQCIFSGNQFFFKDKNVYSWAGLTYGDSSAYSDIRLTISTKLSSSFSLRYLAGTTKTEHGSVYTYDFIQAGRIRPNWNPNFIHMSATEADDHGYYSKHPEYGYPYWELDRWATEGHIIYKNGKQWRSFKEPTHFYPTKDIMNVQDICVVSNWLLVTYYRPKPYETGYDKRYEAVVSAYVKNDGVYNQVGDDAVIFLLDTNYSDFTKIVINNTGTEVAIYGDPVRTDSEGHIYEHRIWRGSIDLDVNELTFSVSVTEHELIQTSNRKQTVLAIAYDGNDKLRLLISDDNIINATVENGWTYENSVQVLERTDGEDDVVIWSGYGHALNPLYIKSIIFLFVDLVEHIYVFSELVSTLDNLYVEGEITYGPATRTQRIVFSNNGEETILYTETVNKISDEHPPWIADPEYFTNSYGYAYAVCAQTPHRIIDDRCDYYGYTPLGGYAAFDDEWSLLYPTYPDLGIRAFLFNNHIYDVAVVVDPRRKKPATELTSAVPAAWVASVRIYMVGACNSYIDITWMGSSFGDLHNYIPTCDSNGNKLSESTTLTGMSLTPIGLY